jgi:D-serine deaminase-like pyridoxal phosphate-dependent protein
LDWVVEQADRRESEVYFWVDSLAGIAAAEAACGRAGAGVALRVLVEVGHLGGRTGCRSLDAAVDVARAASRSPSLELYGVSCFEGLVAPDSVEAVVPELLALVDATVAAIREERLAATDRLIVTAGGSAYFDRVIEALGRQPRDLTRPVLRSGCYVIHDNGFYEQVAPRRGAADLRLRAALEVWSAVHSTPEPGLAIAGFGKRDVGFDMGMPRPLHLRRNGTTVPIVTQMEIIALNDQHAHVADPEGLLHVGDLLGVGVSHPCTTLDKWSRLALVDDEDHLLEWVDTAFVRHGPIESR